MAIRSRSGKEGRTDEPDPEPRAGRHPTPRVHEQENGNDHAIGAPTAVDQASARRPARNAARLSRRCALRDPADEGRTHEMTLPGGSGARIGYARVSTPEQDMSLQIDALERAGCSRIFQDVASGAKAERKGLDEALAYLRPGDTLVVWKIDRLGRSLAHLVGVVEDLRSRGIGFRSLTDPGMDTTTASGALIFHIFGALAAFERELIRERTKAGLAVAAARGRRGGRRPVVTAAVLKRAKALMHDKGLTVREAAGALKIGKTALYDALRADEIERQEKAAKTR